MHRHTRISRPGGRFLLALTLVGGLALVLGIRGPQAQARPTSQLPGQLTVRAGGPYSGQVGRPITFRAQVGLGGRPPGTSVNIQWQFGDGGTGFGEVASHTYGAPGTYAVVVTAIVGAGQTAVDTTTATVAAPVQPIVVRAGGPYSGQVGQPVTFFGSASGVPFGAGVQYLWSFGDGATGSGQTTSHVYGAPGSYGITLTVSTSGGQRGTATSSASIAPPPQPLRAEADGPYSGSVGQPVTLQGRVLNNPFGAVLNFQWNFGDGTTGLGATTSHVYQRPGVYTAILTVTTSGGQQASDTAMVSISQLLQAEAGGPYTGTAGQTVTFEGESTGAINPQYTWNFGDGTGGGGVTTSHVYANAGVYTARLTVTDLATGQSAADTEAVTISPPAQGPPMIPQARQHAAMENDVARGVVVLFGGCCDTSGNGLNDTWTWNGSTWTQLSPAASPPGRLDPAMAYDVSHNVMVVFGGRACNHPDCPVLNDTWTWDGTTWSVQSPANRPPALTAAAMAFDAAHVHIVLFGGQDGGGNALGDTWTWDGTTWTKVSPATSPPPRFESMIAYDPIRGNTVLFGGRDADEQGFNDTWIWDGATWSLQLPSNSPPALEAAGMAFDANSGTVIMFGGCCVNGTETPVNSTWTWNGSNWTQQGPLASPPPRADLAMAYDAARGTILMFSGSNGQPDTWTWNGSTWSRLF